MSSINAMLICPWKRLGVRHVSNPRSKDEIFTKQTVILWASQPRLGGTLLFPYFWKIRLSHCLTFTALTQPNLIDIIKQLSFSVFFWPGNDDSLHLLFYCSVREEFRYLTKNIVLATGSYDRPNLLSVPGESLPFVFHSLKDFETLLASKQFGQSTDPVKLKTLIGLRCLDQTFLGLVLSIKL